jgi:hypothetical protein
MTIVGPTPGKCVYVAWRNVVEKPNEQTYGDLKSRLSEVVYRQPDQ